MSIYPNSQFLIYQTESGQTRLEVRLEGKTVWLSQKMMAELLAEATIRKFRIVQTKGKFHQQRLQVEKQHKKQDK